MNTILIDSTIFNFRKPFSSGLISSMKSLSNYGFEIFCIGKIPTEVNIALTNEQIVIGEPKNDEDFDFRLSVEGDKILLESDEFSKLFNDISAACEYLTHPRRKSELARKTKETKIQVSVNLDVAGEAEINTGIGFFDHMLEQIARHGNIYLKVNVEGDLHVDEHHTVEDTGIALGEALLKALGDKRGIKRYGFYLPMDETIAKCALDFGGRQFLNFKCNFNRERVGDFPTELTEEFFRGLAAGMKANLYLRSKGKNDHHKIEAMFKAFAKALNEACRIDERAGGKLPSTKGKL